MNITLDYNGLIKSVDNYVFEEDDNEIIVDFIEGISESITNDYSLAITFQRNDKRIFGSYKMERKEIVIIGGKKKVYYLLAIPNAILQKGEIDIAISIYLTPKVNVIYKAYKCINTCKISGFVKKETKEIEEPIW